MSLPQSFDRKGKEELSEYDQQALDFLKKTGATIESRFFNYEQHFTGETEKRDIFKVTIKKGGEKYTFDFGQSILKSTGTGRDKPTAYDVLTCLTKYDPEDFEWFCSSYGYDTDSRTAATIYDSVCEEWENMQRLFSPEELEGMAEIQ